MSPRAWNLFLQRGRGHACGHSSSGRWLSKCFPIAALDESNFPQPSGHGNLALALCARCRWILRLLYLSYFNPQSHWWTALFVPRPPTLLLPGFFLESDWFSVDVRVSRFLSRLSSKAGAASGNDGGEKSPRSSMSNILLVRLELEALEEGNWNEFWKDKSQRKDFKLDVNNREENLTSTSTTFLHLSFCPYSLIALHPLILLRLVWKLRGTNSKLHYQSW